MTIPKYVIDSFDCSFYLNFYEDLRENGINTETKAEKHFFTKGYFENRFYNPNQIRDRSDFFFIHTFKNYGSTIHYQLPKLYNRRFYGLQSFQEWENKNFEKLNLKNIFEINDKEAIDHISIDVSKEIGILDELDLKNRKFLGLVREPFERLVSMYNFTTRGKIDLNAYLDTVKSKKFLQSNSLYSQYPIDLTVISLDKKELVIDWFNQFNISISFDIHINKSEKKLLVSDLTTEQIKKIKDIFSNDFKLYEEVQNSNGIINNFTKLSKNE